MLNAENTECHLKIFEADGAFAARLAFLEVSSCAIGPVVVTWQCREPSCRRPFLLEVEQTQHESKEKCINLHYIFVLGAERNRCTYMTAAQSMERPLERDRFDLPEVGTR
jgi:hypothetical protein